MPQRRRTPMPWRRSRRKRRLPSDLIILVSKTPATIEAGIAHCADKKPLIYAATAENADAMAKIAKEKKASLAVSASGLEALEALSDKVKAMGVDDLVL